MYNKGTLDDEFFGNNETKQKIFASGKLGN